MWSRDEPYRTINTSQTIICTNSTLYPSLNDHRQLRQLFSFVSVNYSYTRHYYTHVTTELSLLRSIRYVVSRVLFVSQSTLQYYGGYATYVQQLRLLVVHILTYCPVLRALLRSTLRTVRQYGTYCNVRYTTYVQYTLLRYVRYYVTYYTSQYNPVPTYSYAVLRYVRILRRHYVSTTYTNVTTVLPSQSSLRYDYQVVLYYSSIQRIHYVYTSILYSYYYVMLRITP